MRGPPEDSVIYLIADTKKAEQNGRATSNVRPGGIGANRES